MRLEADGGARPLKNPFQTYFSQRGQTGPVAHRRRNLSIIRIIVAVLGAAFAVMILWAFFAAEFWSSFDAITADPWGLVTLADLYLGFFLTAIVIAYFERGLRAVLWIVPLPFLGNVWAVIWFVVRLPELRRRLTGPRASAT